MRRAGDLDGAETPALSSPRKVRDEPVTLWTIEMLPASEIGELGEEERRAEVVGEALVEELLRRRRASPSPSRIVASTAKSRSPPLAATTMWVRAEDVDVAGDAGIVEREAGGIGADPLPVLHLALVAALRDLQVEVERHHRVDRVGRDSSSRSITGRGLLRLGHRLPMRVETLAEAGGQADAGDPDVAGHRPGPLMRLQPSAKPTFARPAARTSSAELRRVGKSISIMVISASAIDLAVDADLARGHAEAGAFVDEVGAHLHHRARA